MNLKTNCIFLFFLFLVYNTVQAVSTVIPVVIHVVHNNGPENLSDAQLEIAIKLLNDDFGKRNPEIDYLPSLIKPTAVDVAIEFRLAKLDPAGKCTSGITRTVSSQTQNAIADNIRNLVYWNDQQYLNIWVVNNLAGGIEAETPLLSSKGKHGVVINYTAIKTIAVAMHRRTLTHEAGIFLGLNDSSDTFMMTNGCGKYFVLPQRNRAQQVLSDLTSKRFPLSQLSNRITTGTNDNFDGGPCKPNADFTYSSATGCEGMTIIFNGHSTYDATNPSLQWNWTFPGGTPSQSTLKNPEVTYYTGGDFDVTLTVSNNYGNEVKTMTKLVKIAEAANAKPLPFLESFEYTVFPPSEIVVHNPDGNISWRKSINASSHGASSVYIHNYEYQQGVGEEDELIVPPVQFSKIGKLYFDFAHTTTGLVGNSRDTLEVLVSTDCGKSFTSVYKNYGTTLNTSAANAEDFIPLSAEWKRDSVDLMAFAAATGIVKFRHTSGFENNLYLDNIRMAQATPVSVDIENTFLSGELIIYPNPGSGLFHIEFEPIKGKMATVKITDMLGQVVFKQEMQLKENNEINLTNNSAGVYLVEIETGEQLLKKKIIIDEN